MPPQRPIITPRAPSPQTFTPGRPPALPRKETHAPSSLRGHDLRNFSPAQRNLWTRGHWHHGKYRGVYGWWWFTGAYWYWYQQPIFPYPDYVSDDVYENDTGDESPADAAPPVHNTDGFYYYCSDPAGYYPDVTVCNGTWEPLAADTTP